MLRIASLCLSLGLGGLSLPLAAHAQVFDVTLGKTKLGTLTLGSRGATTTLQAALTQTPMGVFDGSFTADSTPKGDTHDYLSVSLSSRKTRQISLQFDGTTATQTLIEPASEMTALSDPARVPRGVIDPVRALAALMQASTCPPAMTLYDGRRAVALTPTNAATDGAVLTCAMTYNVIAGPGHLSPLRISKAKMQLSYKSGTLTRITIGSGVFNLSIDRLP